MPRNQLTKSYHQRSINYYRPILIRLLAMREEGCRQEEMAEALTREGFTPFRSKHPFYQVMIHRLLKLASDLNAQGKLFNYKPGVLAAKHASESLKVSPAPVPVSPAPVSPAPSRAVSPAPKKPWVEENPAPAQPTKSLREIEEERLISRILENEAAHEAGVQRIIAQHLP